MKEFQIFLSSPGDCEEERRRVKEIVSRLNTDPLVASFTHLNVVAWDWGAGVPLEALTSPQTAVNRHLTPPEDCELFVGIFNCKLGTPLPTKEFRKTDGSPFLSGSEYEFHRAWESRRRGSAKPEILIYRRKQAGDSTCRDADQFLKLEEFFRQPPFKESGQWIGSVNWYDSTNELSAKLDEHLRRLLSPRAPGAVPTLEEWMKRQASVLTANAGPRYSRDAHVETDISQVFDWLMARQPAIAAFDRALEEVWKEIGREAEFASFRQDFEQAAQALRRDTHWETPPDFPFLLNILEKLETAAWAEHEAHEKADEQAHKTDAWRHREYRLRQAALKAVEANRLLHTYAPLVQKRLLLLTGPAGQGKTHTLVHEINRTLIEGGMAIGILGQTLSATGNLWNAIIQQLEWQGTTAEFLDKLENEAANRKQRALLVIDALNETPDRRRWRNELVGMIEEVLRRPHLALAISIRYDYLDQTLPVLSEDRDVPWVEWDHPGFADVDPDALVAYFDHFGVKAPVAPVIGELINPLYVQLLAKSLIGRQVNHWLPSWLDVWHAWMERLEQEAVEKLGLDDPSRRHPIRRTMNKLAQIMLDDDVFYLSREQADAIARKVTGADGVIGFLCSAGALIDRPREGVDEVIEFGFERLSDTFLADRLFSKLFKGLNSPEEKRVALCEALTEGGLLHPLTSDRFAGHPLQYRRSGLLEALCLAVPRHVGVELPTLIPPRDMERPDWQLAQAFSDSLRWRSRPEEFGAAGKVLFDLWRKNVLHSSEGEELDELIGFALIPGHPFAMELVLHPHLLKQESIGARDAIWTIHLVPLWVGNEHSNLRTLVSWARDARLYGVTPHVALPAARLLSWLSATSQNALRHDAIKGLTRLLAACPAILDDFLPDFLAVNDPYVLEAVLVAVWGVVLDGADPGAASRAARRLYETQFPDGNARWCHITLRHYARCIVEEAHCRGWLPDLDLITIRLPYRSTLPLDEVPSVEALEELDKSRSFQTICYSACRWGDFYRYIIGENSGSLEFSSQPLPGSSEPERPFLRAKNAFSPHAETAIFDLALAGRFVAWNCRKLGWTAARFDTFDTGFYTREYSRIAKEGRNERIGKKYQWIGWHTLLSFLSDNYVMRPDWDRQPRKYSTPDQVGVHLYDPARWLQVVAPRAKTSKERFWHIPSFPPWPLPDIADIRRWERSQSHDLPPSDVITCVPDLPKDWGEGPWLRFTAEHIWQTSFAPGQWSLGNKFFADIWWQIWPMLIHARDLPFLLNELDTPEAQQHLAGIGRIAPTEDWNTPISQWPDLTAEWDKGFRHSRPDGYGFWLPVPWRPFVGECGHPDRRDEHSPVLLPLPSLFREWNLSLDLRGGVVRHQGEPVFGLAGWIFGEDALFARQERVCTLLDAAGYALIWWVRGERRAFINLENHDSKDFVWLNYRGIAFLAQDGTVDVAWFRREPDVSVEAV